MEEDASLQLIVDELREEGIWVTSVKDVRTRLVEGRRDPERMGIFGILSISFVVAVLITVMGFFLYNFLSLRKRVLEFGVMRAIGLSISQLITILSLEQFLTVGAGFSLGTLFGVIVSQVFLPFLQVSQNLDGVVPGFRIIVQRSDISNILIILGISLVIGLLILAFILIRLKLHEAYQTGRGGIAVADRKTGEGVSGFLASLFNSIFSRQELTSIKDDFIIECENLVKIYKVADLEVFALQGLELKVKKGEMVGIIGSSGSGKSTLLNILGGLDTPTGGRVFVNGWNINKMSYRDKILYKRDTIGFVWQNPSRNLVPYLTALENVQLPMILKGRGLDRKWARELLEAVGLTDWMHHKPMQMSGGQQQRVAIAVALANRPAILLADEPTGALDSKTGAEIFQVFKRVSGNMAQQ